MKKEFEQPVIELLQFSMVDVITTSGDENNNPDWSGNLNGGFG